jgi:hypothetical protein
MISSGDVVSRLEMCSDFGVNLQKGMNFRPKPDVSVILMSLRAGLAMQTEWKRVGE